MLCSAGLRQKQTADDRAKHRTKAVLMPSRVTRFVEPLGSEPCPHRVPFRPTGSTPGRSS